MSLRLPRPLLRAATALLVLGLSTGASSAAEKFKAVTTFTVIADMAQNVAGDAAIVESITKPGAEIHNYQPTPGDILRAQDAPSRGQASASRPGIPEEWPSSVSAINRL